MEPFVKFEDRAFEIVFANHNRINMFHDTLLLIGSTYRNRNYIFNYFTALIERDWSTNGAPPHNSKKVQDFLSANVPEFWSKEIWPPSAPDANPLDYYVWSACEKGFNKQSHSNIEAVKVTIGRIMMFLNKEHLIKACSKSYRGNY